MNKPDLLTLSQETSRLISKISEKEMEFFTDDNIEILHDFRVDIRKLRTWLQIFESAGYRVKKLQKLLVHCHRVGDELRNLDVLIHWMKKNPTLVSAESIHTATLKRKQHQKVFMKELIHQNSISKIRHLGRDFLSQLMGISKNDFQPAVKKYIEEKTQEAFNILPYAAEDLKQLHELRKIFKKLRYCLDLMPNIDVTQVERFKELQDILGTINDRRVWIEILQSELKKINEASYLETMFKEEINTKIGEFKTYIASEKNIFNANMRSL